MITPLQGKYIDKVEKEMAKNVDRVLNLLYKLFEEKNKKLNKKEVKNGLN